jgi:cysteine-rich repeat protein
MALQALAGARTAFASCGDGVIEVGEQCDDGDPDGSDCCAADCSFQVQHTTCDHGLAGECLAVLGGQCDGSGSCFPKVPSRAFPYSFGVSLALRNTTGEDRDVIAWKARRAPFQTSNVPLPGDPTVDTEYTFCAYAVTYDGGFYFVDRLVYEKTVAPGAGWRTTRRGWRYRARSADGAFVELNATPIPRFAAGGTEARLPAAESTVEYFDSVDDDTFPPVRDIYFGLINSAGLRAFNYATTVTRNTPIAFRGSRPHTYD